MTSDEKKQLRDKYNRTQRIDGLPFNAVCKDVNVILDALPDSPRNQHFRGKYVEQAVDHSIVFWLVCDDIAVMLDDVVPVDAEPEKKTTSVPTTDAPIDGVDVPNAEIEQTL